MDFSLTGIAVRLFIGLAIGFCIGLTSIGGGALIIPAITLGLGLPPTVAVGTASSYAFLTRLYAVYRHHGLGTIDWRAARFFLMGAMPADALAALLITHRLERAAADAAALARFQANLKTLIAVVVLSAGGLMILRLVPNGSRPRGGDSTDAPAPPRRLALVLTGIVVGALVGSTSIIGALIVPSLILMFRLSPTRTVGTSTIVSLTLSLVTALIYGRAGEVDLATAAWMAVGSLAGVHFGSHLTTRVPGKLLHACVVGLIALAGMAMLLR